MWARIGGRTVGRLPGRRSPETTPGVSYAVSRAEGSSSFNPDRGFDVGGVLIDWNQRYLYRKIIPEAVAMERFLTEVCTADWRAQHDLGVSYEDTIPALVAAHSEWASEIRAWSERFVEMYGGIFEGTVALVRELHRRRVPLVASTNWGAEVQIPSRPQRAGGS